MAENEGQDKSSEKPPEDTEPHPIEFHAIFYPNGELKINCPLMANPILMKGFVEVIKEGVNNIIAGQNQPPAKIHKPGGGYFNRMRGFLRP